MSIKAKVYEEVLAEIQHLIKKNALKPGDRLPSERELSERLNAGRSSVREALRALELLGLIETRHGEGTFLGSYRPYHMIELLSAYIFQEPTIQSNIFEAKRIMEKEAIKLAMIRSHVKIDKLLLIINDDKLDDRKRHFDFFSSIFTYSGNDLMQKVWQLMEEFSYTIEGTTYDKNFYFNVIELLSNNHVDQIDNLYQKE
ncbi:FadR/GntR family transcriptional regulator [Aquibacillus kalidii]|uniref:FadR/GntR family transcriptional regulator n=1 Tax=Aquibacillus kalidii TaxID=2762597 RepID=UPI001646A42D|nr:GntR family transcriptional regulator [Aquibacillus kalidii]